MTRPQTDEGAGGVAAPTDPENLGPHMTNASHSHRTTDVATSGGEALAEALAMAEAGYVLGPVTIRLDGRGKKVPAFHTEWKTDPAGLSGDPAQLCEWAREHPGTGFHAPTGPNGIVIAEGDVKRNRDGELVADGRRSWRAAGGPKTPMTVTTQSGGEHWYFRAPRGEPIHNSASAIPGVPHVDVRGDGGTVFTSGTHVHGGGVYAANRIVPRDQLPELGAAWEEKLRAAGPKVKAGARRSRPSAPCRSRLVSASSVKDRTWIEAKVDDELRELGRCPADGRFRDALFEAAAMTYRAVGVGVVSEEEAEERLTAAIRRAWDAAPDTEDRGHISRGRLAAEADPWVLAAEDVPAGPERAPQRPDGALPTLPASFWPTRPALEHIRQAAHARCVSADLVLHVVLARLASLQHHATRVETGLGAAVLNVFTALVGPSGAGKSSGAEVASELLPAEEVFAIYGADGYRDGVPIGSGEGLAELFIGTKKVEAGTKKDGTPSYSNQREQVRHNAFVYVDEGEALFRMTERKGATIASALRSTWTGGVLGQSNASAETTRVIPAKSYALGLVIGVQVDTVAPLFDDAAGGTPQRFLFAAATDPTIPTDPPAFPGPLKPAPAGIDADRTIPVVDQDVRSGLRADHLARHRGEVEAGNPLDAHAPLHLAKVAALLALLDDRREVNGEDWTLAAQVWRTSTEVRSTLLDRGRELEREQAERRTEAYVDREQRAAIARDQAPSKVARIALRLALRAHDGEDRTKGALKKRLAAKERGLLDEALEHAADAGWITVTGNDVAPAGERPA